MKTEQVMQGKSSELSQMNLDGRFGGVVPIF